MKQHVSVEFDFEVDLDRETIELKRYKLPNIPVKLPPEMEKDVIEEAEEAYAMTLPEGEDFDQRIDDFDQRIDDELMDAGSII